MCQQQYNAVILTHNVPTITVRDKGRLMDAIHRARDAASSHETHLDTLHALLRDAEMVSPQDVPPNVITMNTRFEMLDLRTHETSQYVLVFPWQTVREKNIERICLPGPSGMQILGARIGETVRWRDRRGPRLSRIERIVYQPEAVGDFYA